MGIRKITVKKSVAESIAAIAWFIESKGLVVTAEKFSDNVYDFFVKLADDRRSYSICREPARQAMGYKCVSYKKNIQSYLLKPTKSLHFVNLFLPK
jgi:hypothetical protein